jgi:hypothetical protein
MQANKFESKQFQLETNPSHYLMETIKKKKAVEIIIDYIEKNENLIDFTYLNGAGGTFLHACFIKASQLGVKESLSQIYKKKDLLKLLPHLLGKVNINAKNNYRETVMDLIINDYFEFIELLLLNGAEIDEAKCKENIIKRLEYYYFNEYSETMSRIFKLIPLKILEEIIDYRCTHPLGNNDLKKELLIAIERGHLDIVKLLIEKGAQVDEARIGDSVTPLLIAAGHGHLEIVKLLIEKGAQVNQARISDGGLPLFFAAQNGHAEVVELLIQKGAEIDVKCSTTIEILKRVVERNGQGGAKERLTNYIISQELQRLTFLKPEDPQMIEITLFDLLKIIGHKEIIAMLESKQEEERLALNSSFQNN